MNNVDTLLTNWKADAQLPPCKYIQYIHSSSTHHEDKTITIINSTCPCPKGDMSSVDLRKRAVTTERAEAETVRANECRDERVRKPGMDVCFYQIAR